MSQRVTTYEALGLSVDAAGGDTRVRLGAADPGCTAELCEERVSDVSLLATSSGSSAVQLVRQAQVLATGGVAGDLVIGADGEAGVGVVGGAGISAGGRRQAKVAPDALQAASISAAWATVTAMVAARQLSAERVEVAQESNAAMVRASRKVGKVVAGKRSVGRTTARWRNARRQAAAARKAAKAAKAVKVSKVGVQAVVKAVPAVAPIVGVVLAVLVPMFVIVALIGAAAISSSAVPEGFSANEAAVFLFLKGKGLDDVHIAAIMGNIQAESSFDSGSVEQGSGAGHGICQWTGGRWWNLQILALSLGKPWTDIDVQLELFWREYSASWSGDYTITRTDSYDPGAGTSVAGSKADFESTSDVDVATEQFCYGWERPGVPHITVRKENARDYLSQIRSAQVIGGGSTSAYGFIYPLPEHFTWTSGFGQRWGSMHLGLDIGAPTGTEVYAVATGNVTFAGWDSSGGYMVVIDHGGGVVTKYMHASRLNVYKGQRVYQGQVIMYVGSTGNSTGPHLHFQVEIGGVAVDPVPYLPG